MILYIIYMCKSVCVGRSGLWFRGSVLGSKHGVVSSSCLAATETLVAECGMLPSCSTAAAVGDIGGRVGIPAWRGPWGLHLRLGLCEGT